MRRWPWQTRAVGDRLVIGGHADALAWVQATADGILQRCGLLLQGGDGDAEFGRRVRALGLPERDVCAVLDLSQAQWLQIEAPAVTPEEMKAAARWRAKDLVDGRIEEFRLDVMVVGGDHPHPHRQLFVVAAHNALVQTLTRRCQTLGLQLAVIDAAEAVQRNLQTAAAAAEGMADRACAALVRHGSHWLLTVCAGGELFYTRRLDWDSEGLVLPTAAPVADEAMEGLDFIDYGSMSDAGGSDDVGAPRMVIELQRSFDLWERSWPDLPLAGVWLETGDDCSALAGQLAATLGLPVWPLTVEGLFPGFEAAAGTPDVRAATLPLLGALLRSPARQL
jgi:MSHA biogenesis protein MshI